MADDAAEPVLHRFTGRSRLDDQVHLVSAPLDAVACPAAYTTWCGQAVVAIYQDGRPVTCSGCARSGGGAPATSTTSDAELRTGEHVR